MTMLILLLEFKHCFDDFSKVWTTNFIKLEVIKNEANKLLQANNKMKFLVEVCVNLSLIFYLQYILLTTTDC